MADTSAWDLGAQIAEKGITGRRERKQALSDEARQLHVTDLYHKADALSTELKGLTKGTDAYNQKMQKLIDIEGNLRDVYHPDKNPGAIQKDWHLITGLLQRRKPTPALSSTIQTSDVTLSPAVVPPPGTTPTTPDVSPTPVSLREVAKANLSPYAYQGRISTVPSTLRAKLGPGTPAKVPPADTTPPPPAMSLPGAPVTVPGRTVNVRLATPEQAKQMTRREEAQRAAELDVAAAGLTPEEELQAQQAKDEATRQWQLDWAKRHDITGEALDELTQHLAGMPAPKARFKPLGKPYQDPTTKLWLQPQYDPDTGKIEDMPMGEHYTPPPEHQTMYQQQLGTFASSLGKTSGDLSWAEERAFLTDRYGAQQPLAQRRLDIAEQNSQIMQANLDLRRAENNWHDYIDTTKQLTPLEKISTTSQRADEFVRSPSGAGDVSLVFAFIDATKPGSGFRFTETERRWITTGSRGVVDGALTRINQGFTGETLSEEQRQHMAAIIKQAATQANAQRDAILGGAAQINPTAAAVAASATVPATPAKPGATPKTPKGGAVVSDDEFLRKFPKAQ